MLDSLTYAIALAAATDDWDSVAKLAALSETGSAQIDAQAGAPSQGFAAGPKRADGAKWQTGKRWYQRVGGKTVRIADPNAGASSTPTPAPAPASKGAKKAPTQTPAQVRAAKAKAATVLNGPYFNDIPADLDGDALADWVDARQDERHQLADALATADDYPDLKGRAKTIFDAARQAVVDVLNREDLEERANYA